MTNAPSAASLIDYPSRFPIKVMGANVDGFVHAMVSVVRQFDAAFDAATVELRPSKGNKYLGVTLTVMATSREQLDELYRTLSTHPMVKVVL
jgi:putative lipoic acid-binding regulatory protein